MTIKSFKCDVIIFALLIYNKHFMYTRTALANMATANVLYLNFEYSTQQKKLISYCVNIILTIREKEKKMFDGF